MRKFFVVFAVAMLFSPFAAAQARNIDGSTVVFDSYIYNSATDVDLYFTATGATTNAEYLDQVTINLPAPWTIVSLTNADFEANSGVGTSTARFTRNSASYQYPCSGWGISCSGGCQLVVKINPNGVMTAATPVTWMIEGDAWQAVPNSVLCSVGDGCLYDACYTDTGINQTGLDLDVGTVPVELMSFEIE